MPIRFNDILSMVQPAPEPSRYQGNAPNIIQGNRRMNMQEEEQNRRFGLDQQQEQRLAQGQKQNHDIALGNLAVQRGQLDRSLAIDDSKRFADLYDAAHAGDTNAIELASNELRRNGYEVDLPSSAPASQPAKPAAEPATPSPEIKPEAAPAKPADQKAVSDADRATGEELDSMQSGILSQLAGVPMPKTSTPRPSADRKVKELELSPGDSLLQPQPKGPTQPEAGPQAKPSTTGQTALTTEQPRIQVRRGDQVAFDIDPKRLDATRRQAVTDIFLPLAKNGNEIQTAAAQKAMQSTLARLGTAPLKEVIAAGMEQYEHEVDQLMGVRRAAASKTGIADGIAPGFGGSGMTKNEYAVATDKLEWANKIVQQNQQRYGFQGLAKIEEQARNVMAAIDEKTGVGDLAAITSTVSSLQGGRVSDADMRQALGSGGPVTAFQNMIDAWTKSGRKDPQFMRQFRALAGSLAAAAAGRRRYVAEQTAAEISDAGNVGGWSPEETNAASAYGYNALVGSMEGRRPVARRQGSQTKKPAAAAPAKPAGKAPAKPGNVQQKWGIKLNVGGGGP